MSTLPPWNRSQFYDLGDPLPSPMMWGMRGGFKNYALKATCRGCGQWYTQSLRIHLVKKNMITGFAEKVPEPSEGKLAFDFMLRTHDNAVGCWSVCRPWKHLKICQLPSMRLLLGHNASQCPCPISEKCTCPTGCGNVGIWPCRCGKMFGGKHTHERGCPASFDPEDHCQCKVFGMHRSINGQPCPVGMTKRVGPFSIQDVQKRLARGAS